LTVLNLTYYLLGQLIPGWVALMFFRRVRPGAVSVGIVAGVVASVVLYVLAPDLGGVNAGLVAVLLNLALTFGLSRVRPGEERTPLSRVVLRSAKPDTVRAVSN
jgi:SSS family solute:Na+ symporter